MPESSPWSVLLIALGSVFASSIASSMKVVLPTATSTIPAMPIAL
jgi:hypothetical protein